MLDNSNITLFDKREQSLEERISAIDRFDGMDYASILDLVGCAPKCTNLKENTIERTWIEDGYFVCLLFDEHDICLGVWEETRR